MAIPASANASLLTGCLLRVTSFDPEAGAGGAADRDVDKAEAAGLVTVFGDGGGGPSSSSALESWSANWPEFPLRTRSGRPVTGPIWLAPKGEKYTGSPKGTSQTKTILMVFQEDRWNPTLFFFDSGPSRQRLDDSPNPSVFADRRLTQLFLVFFFDGVFGHSDAFSLGKWTT
jgi:hypothetical protein